MVSSLDLREAFASASAATRAASFSPATRAVSSATRAAPASSATRAVSSEASAARRVASSSVTVGFNPWISLVSPILRKNAIIFSRISRYLSSPLNLSTNVFKKSVNIFATSVLFL